MNALFKKGIYVVFAGLLVANIYVFMSGVALSDQINKFEGEINRLHQENLDLEKKTYDAESLTYAAEMADKLDFTKKSTPIYLNNLKYALNR